MRGRLQQGEAWLVQARTGVCGAPAEWAPGPRARRLTSCGGATRKPKRCRRRTPPRPPDRLAARGSCGGRPESRPPDGAAARARLTALALPTAARGVLAHADRGACRADLCVLGRAADLASGLAPRLV